MAPNPGRPSSRPVLDFSPLQVDGQNQATRKECCYVGSRRGSVLTDGDIACGYRIVQGKLDVEDYIEPIYSSALTNDW